VTTLQVQQMPDGYQLDVPSFWYWLRAGAALTLGGACVYVALTVAWLVLLRAVPSLYVLRVMRVL
jgi:hypothetical protein